MPRGRGALGSGRPSGRAGFVGDASSQGMVVGRAPLRSLLLPDASARAGLLAGLLVGGTGLVRVDALREVVLLLPVVALGAAFGGRWPRPVLLGLGVSLLVSAVAAVGLSWQYLASIAGSLVPLLALGVLDRWRLVGWRSCCGGAAGGCRRSWSLAARRRRRASWWSRGSTSPAGRCGRSCARTRTTPGRGTSRGCRRARGCRSTAGAPTRSRPWRGCPGTSGRWRWSWPWSCWPCSCGGRCCRRGRAGSTPGCRRCSSRPGRRCSRWRDPASRPTTRGPTAGC